MFTAKAPFPVMPFKVPEHCKLVIPLSNMKAEERSRDKSWFKMDDYEDIDEEDIFPCVDHV
jgi:hypothetical protein